MGRFGKYVTIPAIIGSIVVISSLLYYIIKFYNRAELIFKQNMFGFFIVFSLIVLFLILILFYFIIDNRKIIKTIVEKEEKIATIESMLNDMIKLNNVHLNQTECQFDQLIKCGNITNKIVLDKKE